LHVRFMTHTRWDRFQALLALDGRLQPTASLSDPAGEIDCAWRAASGSRGSDARGGSGG
jgi:hypothetical protein